MKPLGRRRADTTKPLEAYNDPGTANPILVSPAGAQPPTGYAIRVIVCRARRNRCPE